MLGIGLALLPVTRPYWWTAIIADVGTLQLVWSSPRLLKEAWQTSRFSLIREYIGHTPNKTVCLRLFRRGVFTIRLEMNRSKPSPRLVSMGRIGKWTRSGSILTADAGNEVARFEVISLDSGERLKQLAGFTTWEKSEELSLAGIEFQSRVTDG
jgi:hypothetical protein